MRKNQVKISLNLCNQIRPKLSIFSYFYFLVLHLASPYPNNFKNKTTKNSPPIANFTVLHLFLFLNANTPVTYAYSERSNSS